ncbi:hypothetical protein SM418_33610 [Actinomadura chokoriensis]|uniref:Uncharacterized protein n=1 Tax=Actinomadura chokoriensis TaxID=454156 RepID=A0ABV4R8R8_9ACTN
MTAVGLGDRFGGFDRLAVDDDGDRAGAAAGGAADLLAQLAAQLAVQHCHHSGPRPASEPFDERTGDLSCPPAKPFPADDLHLRPRR